MEINWFTVIAQIVNFLILVWLLKRFLYKPVLNAIDEREKKIAAQLKDAEAKKAEAKNERRLYRQKNELFDKERTTKMNEAHEQVNAEKQRLFEEVRQESNALRSKFEEAFKQQEQKLKDTLKTKTKDAVFSIAGKTLADLANAELEEQAVKVFIKKIQDLDKQEKEKFIEALNNLDTPIIVKSVFELSPVLKQELEKAIEKIAKTQNDFQYELKPKLVSGIEIETAYYQLSWNIDSYLDALNKDNVTKI